MGKGFYIVAVLLLGGEVLIYIMPLSAGMTSGDRVVSCFILLAAILICTGFGALLDTLEEIADNSTRSTSESAKR